MHFTEVWYKNDYDYPSLVFKHEAQDEDDGMMLWEMPFEAIGNRIELYGLDGVEHAIEFLAQEVNNSEASSKHVYAVTTAYTEVVNSEFAQSLMPHARVDDGPKQTALNRMSISSDKRMKLTEARQQALEEIGVRTPGDEEPRMGTLSTGESRSVASLVLDAEESVVERACSIVEEHRSELEAWRLETPFSACPQIRELAERQMSVEETGDPVRMAGYRAGMQGTSSQY